ncbi:TadE/TadG family type IV pilus assembly protein [Roseicyclus persicicus]|uniref:Pilus assembly protein n=1 Tax=Roseicyclus persicicus TaxID=2650661 RepID=A0A7X6GW40_9RHOB|nr:TadE/TadG family type IV pilus assembly protein [Roseibacterium persicicum]NKX43398.1 pilus assembly protein [Roseibacterium persicicum]
MRHTAVRARSTAFALRAMHRLPRRFLRREDGTVTVFSVIVFVLMVGVGGIAVDVMRYETQRAQLQYTLDRAVLAAASLSQTLEPEDVVRNYFETAGLADYRLRVQVEEGINFRRVSAQAEMELQTLFMSLFGQRVLTSPAAGAAEERVRNIEVSMVLDISGSMGSSNRMTNLKPAARDFVTSILAANDNPNNDQLVSVSIVPYNGHVNVGTRLSSVFALTNEHSYSRCSRFYWDDFTVSGLDPTVPIQRMVHFDISTNNWVDPIPNPRCPTNDYGAILPWSNSEAELHAVINSFNPGGTTAIDAGMRWAVALLDPLARPALSGLVSDGHVHPDFDGRPAAYGDGETLKIVVLMTDGANTEQYDVAEQYRSGPSPFWRDPDDGDFSVYYAQWNLYWQEDNDTWRSTPDGGPNNNAVRLDYADLWNHIPVREVEEDLFHRDAWEEHDNRDSSVNLWRRSTIQAMGDLYEYWDIVDQYVWDDEGDRRLRRMCDVAHASGIVVFSISFEAPSRGQSVMRYCASSDAHYYDVEGIDISNAFASIARTINQLRLIQ